MIAARPARAGSREVAAHGTGRHFELAPAAVLLRACLGAPPAGGAPHPTARAQLGAALEQAA
jgi:hypothetical protein